MPTKRIRTGDRLAFYTTEKIGDTREVTPEGYLLCRGVAIARTGTQLYGADEIPIDPGPDGLIRIERLPEEVFRDETLASFEGKSVTVEHPEDGVTPENWQKLTVGTVQNVRRGEGIDDDLIMADLLITAADAIAYVNDKLPEVSAGYEADYEQTEPGRGLQRSIIGNHVALVERGRAGPRCAIKDEDINMKTKDKASLLARLMKAIRSADADEIKATMADAEEEETEEQKAKREAAEKEKKTTDSIAKLTATVDALTAAVAKLTTKDAEGEGEKTDDADEEEEEDEDGEKKQTADDILEPETGKKADTGTTYTGDTLKEIVARAEILAPGIAIPTGDAIKAKDAAPKLMRKALETCAATKDGAEFVKPFLMGREIGTLTGDALLGVFNGAAELARIRNNAAVRVQATTQDFGRTTTAADINARNRDFWARTAR